MNVLQSLGRHLFLVMSNFLISCLILVFTRNFLTLDLPLFEEIICASFLSTALTLGCSFSLKRWKRLNDSNLLLAYINIIALLLSVLILPYSLLNVDRSRSFYVLSWVDQNKISMSDGQILVEVLSRESSDISGVSQRIEEQRQRGLVSEINGLYRVTKMGSFILGTANFLAELFNLENWNSNKS